MLAFTRLAAQQDLSSWDSLRKMPPFTYFELDGRHFSPDELNKKQSTVIIYFNPDCDHCQKQAKVVTDNIDKFPNVLFVFVSRADSAAMKKFADDMEFSKYPQVKIVIDRDRLYHTFTRAHSTPSIHIYNRKKKLVIYSEGVMSKETLLQYLEK